MEASAEFFEIELRPEPREKGNITFHTNFVRPADMDTIQNRSRFTCSIPAKEFMDDGNDPNIQDIYYFMIQSKVDEDDALRVMLKLIDFTVGVTSSVRYLPHYGLTVWLTLYVVPCSHETYLDDLSLEETFQASLDDEYEKNSGLRPASKLLVKSFKKLSRRRYERKRKTSSKADQCTICLKEFREPRRVVKLPCAHKFDRKCISRWLKYNHFCPLCRYEFPCEGNKNIAKVESSTRKVPEDNLRDHRIEWQLEDNLRDHRIESYLEDNLRDHKILII